MDHFFSSLNFRHSSLITHHSSLITHHLSLITHHLKHPTPFDTITHFSSLNIFHTICGPHTCHLVKENLFCGPHHFLFSHFPSFTPVTLPKLKPEPSFNHKTKTAITATTTAATTTTTTTKYGQLDS